MAHHSRRRGSLGRVRGLYSTVVAVAAAEADVKLCLHGLHGVDRSVRIDSLHRHVQDLVTQRAKLQFEETQLHDRYEQVCICVHALDLIRLLAAHTFSTRP